MTEHTILVAFTVEAERRDYAHLELMAALERVPLGQGPFQADNYVESWWVAEDDRADGSDSDSAVFVHPGAQHAASALLLASQLTPEWNVPPDVSGGKFTEPDRDVVGVGLLPVARYLINHYENL